MSHLTELEKNQHLIVSAGLAIAEKLIRKAMGCVLKDQYGDKIHSPEGMLTSASTYIKSATVAIDTAVFGVKPSENVLRMHRDTIQKLINYLEELINLPYEKSRFVNVLDKKAFEYKYEKVRHHARVLRNRLKQLLR